MIIINGFQNIFQTHNRKEGEQNRVVGHARTISMASTCKGWQQGTGLGDEGRQLSGIDKQDADTNLINVHI